MDNSGRGVRYVDASDTVATDSLSTERSPTHPPTANLGRDRASIAAIRFQSRAFVVLLTISVLTIGVFAPGLLLVALVVTIVAGPYLLIRRLLADR